MEWASKMKKSKTDAFEKGSNEIVEQTKRRLVDSVVVSDRLTIAQTSTGSTRRLDETKMGETTVVRTNENSVPCPEKEVTSSELRRKHGDFFRAGREVVELAKQGTHLFTVQASAGPSDGHVTSSAVSANESSSVVETNIATQTTLNTKSNFTVLAGTQNSAETSSNLNDRNLSDISCSRVPENLCLSVPERCLNEGLKLQSSSLKNDSCITVPKEKTDLEQKNISVIASIREKMFGNSAVHNVHLSKSNQSVEMNQQREMSPSSTKDNPPMSISVREVITTDIPQSLSTDSGIGSPQDVRTCIDPSPGQDAKLGQDGKWEVENYSLSSLASGVVVPDFKERSGNYRSCDDHTGVSALPSSSDTSNYSTSASATSGKYVRATALPKQEVRPRSSLTSSEERNLDLHQMIPPYEKDAASQPLTTSLLHIPQSILKPEDNTLSLQSKHSIDITTGSIGETTHQRTSEPRDLSNKNLLDSSNQRTRSSLCTFQTSEFTVECESGNSICELRKETISPSAVRESECRHSTSDAVAALKNSPLLEKLIQLSKSAERIKTHNSESSKEVTSEDVGSSSAVPPGRKVKGILKASSAPTLGENRGKAGTIGEFKNGQSKGEAAASRSVSFNQTHIKSTFSYNNVAFEGEIITEPSKRASLAEVVNQIMKHSAVVEMDEENSHPYGRDNSLTDLMTGKHHDNYKMDAGKMIVWLALAIMIVSLAGGIIFMSETYNMSHRDQEAVIPSYDTTTHEHRN